MKHSLLILTVVLFSCGTGTNKTQEKNSNPEILPVKKPPEFEVNPLLVNELFVFEKHDQTTNPFKQVETQSVDLNNDGQLDKITLFVIENWGDPGNFQKIRIELSGQEPYEFSNYSGWVTFNENYSVSEKITSQNELTSVNILLINGTPKSKLILIFGWVYANDPGLATIIDPSNKIILFNKQWDLKSITDTNSDKYLELRGSSYFDGAIELLDLGTPKLELKSE